MAVRKEDLEQGQDVQKRLELMIHIEYYRGRGLKFLKRRMGFMSKSYISEMQLQWLKEYYVIREETAVQHILRQYPFLVQLLREAYGNIETHFPDAPVFLDATVDPEGVDSYPKTIDAETTEELVIFIATRLPSREAVEALERFYDDWWLNASKAAQGKLSIGLECL